MSEMFVSYCHGEMKLVDPIISVIAKDHNVWIDHLLQTGELFNYTIDTSIDRCDVFLVFLSIYYVKSSYCLKEIRKAMQAKKSILPVALDAYDDIVKACSSDEMRQYVEYIRDNILFCVSSDIEEIISNLINSDIVEQCENHNPVPIQFPNFKPEFVYTDEMVNMYTYNYRPDGTNLLDMIGRERELKQLHDFVNADRLKKWWMVLGPGGSGKSRLSYQFACDMHEEGWDVYYLTVNIESQLEAMESRLPNDRLVVIDYALSHNNAVSAYLKSLCGRTDNHFKVKVLLVDRDMAFNSNEFGTSRENIEAATRFIQADEFNIDAIKYKAYPYIDLKPLNKEHLKTIIIQYAKQACGKDMDEDTSIALSDRLTKIDKNVERPLYAIFMADAWVNGNNPLSWDKEHALAYVYKKEKEIWFKDAPIKDKKEYDAFDIDVFINAVSELVSYATVNGGLSLQQLSETCPKSVERISESLRKGMDLEDYLDNIGMLFRRDKTSFMAAFKPDLVGEYIVLSQMKKKPRMVEGIFTEEWYRNTSKTEFITNMFMDYMGELKDLEYFWDRLLDVDPDSMTYIDKNGYVFFLKNFVKTGNNALNQKIIETLLRMRGSGKRLDSVIYSNIADICLSMGNPKQAELYYKKTHEIQKRLSEDTGTVESLRDLSVSYNKLGEISKSLGDHVKSQEYYKKSLEIDKRLSEDTGTVESLRDLSVSYDRLGDISKSLGDHVKSQEYYKKSLGIRERLSEETGTVESLRDLSVSYNRLGDISKSLGDHVKSQEYYKKSTGTVESLRDLSVSYNKLGDISKSLGDHVKSQEYYKKSHEILSRLSEDTGTVESLRDLAISYERLGGIEAAFGRPREAQEYYEKELEIAKRLLDETDKVDARRFISVVYSFLGDISKSLGDHEKSQEYYKKSLGISERLSEETGTVESLDDLAVSYYKIGSIVLDNSEKMKYYQKASDIWNDLRKKYPSVKMFADRYRIVSNVMKDIPDVKPKSGRKSWFKWFKK